MPVTQNVYTVPNNFDLQYNQGQKKIRADLVDQNFSDAADAITYLLGDAANSVHKTGNEAIAGNKTFTGNVNIEGGLNCTGDANFSGNVEIAELGTQLKTLILQTVFPVGSIYTTTNNTNPATLFGFGTWEQIEGRMILGVSGSHPVYQTGGEETHTLTQNETPAHTHTRGTMEISGGFTVDDRVYWGEAGANAPYGVFGRSGIMNMYDATSTSGGTGGILDFYASRTWTGATSSVGGNGAHNNMPPYYAAYIWRRTA